MADFRKAVDNTLRFEDASLSGVVTIDKGGRTRFGIAERFHPELGPRGFYELDRMLALGIAEDVYARVYWLAPYQDLASQLIANKLFDMGVNEGVGGHYSTHALQRSLYKLGSNNPVDGVLGPATIAAANTEDELELLHLLRMDWRDLKLQELAKHPEDEKYRNGWLRRALA